MADLDLQTGDPSRADEDTPAGRRRRRRTQTADDKPRGSEPKTEQEIRNGLQHAFDAIARNRDARGDEELAIAITEERDVMTEGIVTLTEGVPVFRNPIIIILHVLITLLAFGRVGGILFDRARERRAVARAEAEQQQGFDPSAVIIEN